MRLADGSRLRSAFALRKDSRQVLSLVFDYSMSQELVQSVIEHLDSQEILALFHSDQGKQYGAKLTVNMLLEKGFTASMSRAGNPSVFASNKINGCEYFNRSFCNIAHVANRRRNNVEFAFVHD